MKLSKCPDCGAAPAESRCECDFAGARVERKIAELRDRNAGLSADNYCMSAKYRVLREALERIRTLTARESGKPFSEVFQVADDALQPISAAEELAFQREIDEARNARTRDIAADVERQKRGWRFCVTRPAEEYTCALILGAIRAAHPEAFRDGGANG